MIAVCLLLCLLLAKPIGAYRSANTTRRAWCERPPFRAALIDFPVCWPRA
ncbi:MAG: hypothetical protein ACLUI3_06700 [Christensenellales bacterium]